MSVQAREHRGRVGRSAAQSGRYGQVLFQFDPGAGGRPATLRQGTGGPETQIPFVPGDRLGQWPGNVQLQAPGLADFEPVANPGEDDEAVDLMVAVRAPAGHVQIEVDLGPGPGSDTASRRPGGRFFPVDGVAHAVRCFRVARSGHVRFWR
jgi:hypothetical protein